MTGVGRGAALKYPFLHGGGTASDEIAAFDWSKTSVGEIETWPSVLKTTLGLMLRSAFPKALVWGPDLYTFHNEAFRPILGHKPPAIGRPFSQVWEEAWSEISPIAADAMSGNATYIENFPLVVLRGAVPEQAFFTFCYSPVVDEDGRICGFMDTVVETTRTVISNEEATVLNRELEHRIKNMLSVVGAIASQTIRSSENPQAAEESFSQRLRALADVQGALRIGSQVQAQVDDIINATFDAHAIPSHRVSIRGPKILLPETKSLALSLAANELTTNAVKYGALSNADGRIEVEWRPVGTEDMIFEWRETAGPPVAIPTRRGFGPRLIERHVAAAFGGEAKLIFDPTGVSYRISPASTSL